MTGPSLAIPCLQMGNLSEDDCIVISKHPLNNSLDLVRDSLRKAKQSDQPGPTNFDDAGNNADQGPLQAVLVLFATLQIHKVAHFLNSKTRTGNLASELLTLSRRLWNVYFNYEHYRVLSQLVIKMAPDVDIWNAVFDLISFISRLTPLQAFLSRSTVHQSYTPPPRCNATSRRRGS